MKKFIYAFLTAIILTTSAWAEEGIIGYWTMVDDESNQAKSIVQIYEYQGKYYGRVVELLRNRDAKAKLPDSPAIEGLDVIWDLQKKKDRYTGGEILDPNKGKVYGCEIWREGDNLIVRGKIAFLGRNQTWFLNKDYQGDTTPPVPHKPRLK